MSARSAPGMGRLILVGAGPGDPDLITVRGTAALGRADLVLFDEIGTVIDSVRKRSSNRIMPQVVEIENVFKNLRRKILKSKSVKSKYKNI